MEVITLNELYAFLNPKIDALLVDFTEYPEQHDEFQLPSPVQVGSRKSFRTFYRKETPACSLREQVIYSCILDGFECHYLEMTEETLLACICQMRRCPYIDYYDLSNYHRWAAQYYRKQGKEMKAQLHERTRLLIETRMNVVEDEEPVSFVELLDVLKGDTRRYPALLLYILRFVSSYMKVNVRYFYREQYTLIEQTLARAAQLYIDDSSCDKRLRSCLAYYESLYYGLTDRPALMEKWQKVYLDLNGGQDYELLCDVLLEELPPVLWSEQNFVNYVLTYHETHGDDGDADDNLDEQFAERFDVYMDLPTYGFFRKTLMRNAC